jgi:leukotriene-A4 hydrolase
MSTQSFMKVTDSQSEYLETPTARDRDLHSFSNPEQVRVRHLNLDLTVSFENKTLHGIAVLTLERLDPTKHLVVDTMKLKILKTEVSFEGINYSPASSSVDEPDAILGSALTIELSAEARYVRIEYLTVPSAPALQWLDPHQTAGKENPFLLTQSQTIHARSWIPLQDSPQVRVTYEATVRTPPALMAVMSAADNPQSLGDGEYHFVMPQPIPSYLIALAVGDLAFKSLGPRSGVYAELPVIEKSVLEFGDLENMIGATEKLYGPYLWDRYDLLVLPPSFPLGGMENPRLTFVTPTILAGDRSLVSVIVHEIAHAWSGNLVTNATWSDFWLNEGFAVYVERRVIEELYGKQRAEMEAVLGRQELKEEIAKLEDADEILYVNLTNRDPEDGVTRIPYEKGALFLRLLEETFGRPRFDRFMRGYFDQFAFQSITTSDFLAYASENLLDGQVGESDLIREWLYEPGLPASSPKPKSEAFASVEGQANLWLQRQRSTRELVTSSWTTHEWLHFLRFLPKHFNVTRMTELDRCFQLTKSQNNEIAHQWLLMAIRNHYRTAFDRLKEFLVATGRGKLIEPLYEELAESIEGKRFARDIYEQARPGYHPLVAVKIDRALDWKPGERHDKSKIARISFS